MCSGTNVLVKKSMVLLHSSRIHTVLSLSSGIVVARYTDFNLKSMINGLIHGAIDVSAGIPWRKSGAFTFFLHLSIKHHT